MIAEIKGSRALVSGPGNSEVWAFVSLVLLSLGFGWLEFGWLELEFLKLATQWGEVPGIKRP